MEDLKNPLVLVLVLAGPSAGGVEEVELEPGEGAPGWTVCGGPAGGGDLP